MGWTGKKTSDFLIRKTMLAPDFLPDIFCSRNRQRHVNSVQRHPVDQTLPIMPLPECQGVAKGTIVKEETAFLCVHFSDCLVDRW